jgi:hypothetical protein
MTDSAEGEVIRAFRDVESPSFITVARAISSSPSSPSPSPPIAWPTISDLTLNLVDEEAIGDDGVALLELIPAEQSQLASPVPGRVDRPPGKKKII